MRFLSTVVASAGALLLLAAPAALAAKGDAASSAAMEKRFADLHARAQAASPMTLDDASYKALTDAPRDYSVAVLLTALGPRFGCQLCREFQPQWKLVASSWAKGDPAGEARMLFGTLDFAQGRDTFISLDLKTAPVLLFFPPTHGRHATGSTKPKRFDFNSGSVTQRPVNFMAVVLTDPYVSPPTAEQVHAWLVRHLPGRPHPDFKRPVPYVFLASAVTVLLGVATLVYAAGPYLLPIIQNRNLWAAGTVIAILLFTSGHMFNHIRKVPYVASDGKGGISYVATGFQSQYGLETQIVALLYGIMSFCTIALITRVPRIANPRTQLFSALGLVAVMFVTNSFLLYLFRMKNSGYPFAMPPFM